MQIPSDKFPLCYRRRTHVFLVMSTPVALVLTLTPDNPCNAALCDADGKALYTVHTEHGKETVTYVKNADEEVIASLEWHDTRPDRVTVGKGAPVSLRDWMHFSMIPFKG